MIQTLRITSVAAIILAGLVLASIFGPVPLMGLGGQDDQQSSRALDRPSAVEQYRNLIEGKPQDDVEKTPPLVKQAELLAKIINPPEAPAPSQPDISGLPPKQRLTPPTPSSARFTIAGLSYCPSDPGQSFAFLRLADGTYRWVRAGDEIGHHVVRAINSDSIICWDGTRETEMPVETPPDTASVLETDGGATVAAASEPRPVPMPVAKSPVSSALTRVTSSGRFSQSEQQRLTDLVSRIKQTTDQAARAKLIAEYQASRVSPREAEKLDDLGKEVSGDTAPADQPADAQ